MHTYQSLLILILSSCAFLSSCNKNALKNAKPLLEYEYTEAPFKLDRNNAKFASDIAYGDHSNNKFDIFLPVSKSPTPLVIFIHGGGFTHGYKALAYERYETQIREFIDKEIAFATIDYRFLQDTDRGVISSLEDSKRCLQFLKYYAKSFNIDKNKVVCFGSSAGAGTSLWLALNDDMAEPDNKDPISRESTRMPAVGAIATQATYDIIRWEEVFADYGVQIDRIPDQLLQQLNPFYGLSDFKEVYDQETQAYRKKVDMLSLMDAGDPPMWIKNEQKDVSPMFDLQHHPAHARLLKKYADSLGIDNRVYIPGYDIEDPTEEGLIDFFDRILNGGIL